MPDDGVSANDGVQRLIRRARWQRWWLLHAAQVLLLMPVLFSAGQALVLWPCALMGSALCCIGTDSSWRWPNRILIAEAVLWLTAALVLGVPAMGS